MRDSRPAAANVPEKFAFRTALAPSPGIAPKLKGNGVGDESVPPVTAIAFAVTFCAVAVPVLRIGSAVRSVVGLSKLFPTSPATSTTGDVAHSTSMIRKPPGWEASWITSVSLAARTTGLTILATR